MLAGNVVPGVQEHAERSERAEQCSERSWACPDIIRWTSCGGHRTVDIVRWTSYVGHRRLDIVRWTYGGHRTVDILPLTSYVGRCTLDIMLDIYCDHTGAGRALVFGTYLSTPSQKPGGRAAGKVHFLCQVDLTFSICRDSAKRNFFVR